MSRVRARSVTASSGSSTSPASYGSGPASSTPTRSEESCVRDRLYLEEKAPRSHAPDPETQRSDPFAQQYQAPIDRARRRHSVRPHHGELAPAHDPPQSREEHLDDAGLERSERRPPG